MAPTPLVTDPDRVGRRILMLPPHVLLGVVAALLAIGIIAFFTHRSLESREAAADRVSQTLETLQRLESLLSALKDAETAQRGFLLTSDDSYLAPYTTAPAAIDADLARLRGLTAGADSQQRRLTELDELAKQKLAELDQTIQLQRAGRTDSSRAVVLSDRGRVIMDRIRAVVAEMEADTRGALATSDRDWQNAVVLTTWITEGGSLLLVGLVLAGAVLMSRDHQTRETDAWIRTGQTQLAEGIQGEQQTEALADRALATLATYLDAQAGAFYVTDGAGGWRRAGGYAVPVDPGAASQAGDTLVGQAARNHRPLHVTEVPDGYLTIESALGAGRPRELVIAPAAADGVTHGVVELAFFRAVGPADFILLERVSEMLAVAVRTAADRTRLEALLEETQRQAEELQAQQEELRVNNEELEEHAQAQRESQARLLAQQAELQQINAQLEEQTQALEMQKDELSASRAALQVKALELDRASRYKSEFLANMSHELRTPLNSSLILARMLADNRDGNLTPQQVAFAETISAAGNDLLALINEILDLSKIEAGQMAVASERVAIGELVDGLARGLRPLAEQKGLALDAEVAADVPAIQTDPQRLSQILRNLLSNAIKFTEAGRVGLRVQAGQAGGAVFTVEDTGIGIPAEQQAIIFEPFRQGDGSIHRQHAGAGLGLSISRDLARLLGGDIAVRSTPGAGSVFTLTLPAAAPAVVAPAPPRTPPSVTAGAALPASRPPRPAPAAVADDRDRLAPDARVVLIIEDDVRFAAILKDLAHETGFQCIVAHTAHDGLSAASVFSPSAVLLDIHLPDHSGLGVLEHLKRDPRTRHLPVHVISVVDEMQEALERGAIGYALKPVKREDLLAAFERLRTHTASRLRRVLVVEDDEAQRESVRQLLARDEVEVIGVGTAAEALAQLGEATFDCMVVELSLPDLSGRELLEQLAARDDLACPPVIVHTRRMLTPDEEGALRRFSRSIIVKDARSPERLLDEVTLFLHQVESELPEARQRMLRLARDRAADLQGRRILVVEDDVRNVFALANVLEAKGARVTIARNGREALDALDAAEGGGIDLVLMDIMMPEMDGLTAMREIRARAAWRALPIIALTAKAMPDDHERSLRAGASDYIAKPLDVERLLSLIRVWLPR